MIGAIDLVCLSSQIWLFFLSPFIYDFGGFRRHYFVLHAYVHLSFICSFDSSGWTTLHFHSAVVFIFSFLTLNTKDAHRQMTVSMNPVYVALFTFKRGPQENRTRRQGGRETHRGGVNSVPVCFARVKQTM
ncbi:MAG: hypothetical protein J3R72DRAFT_435067 [Linnemannia gamsii]|nr:MAG: hypothetical protein J3R72DRAFT_435067 [Linnemannia gamsii]